MKIKLLKRLRKQAKYKYYVTYSRNSYYLCRHLTSSLTLICLKFNKNERDIALKECDNRRRDYILNQVKKIRFRKAKTEARKIYLDIQNLIILQNGEMQKKQRCHSIWL